MEVSYACPLGFVEKAVLPIPTSVAVATQARTIHTVPLHRVLLKRGTEKTTPSDKEIT